MIQALFVPKTADGAVIISGRGGASASSFGDVQVIARDHSASGVLL